MTQRAFPTTIFILLVTALFAHFIWVATGASQSQLRHLLGNLSFFPTCLLSAALAWSLARRLSGQDRRAWTFFTAGILCWGAGQAIYTALDLSQNVTFPSLADVGYLLLAPLFLCGVTQLWQPAQSRLQALSFLLDVAIIVVAVGDTIWHTSIRHVAAQYADQPFALMVALAYPGSTLLVVALLLVMASWRSRGIHRAQLTMLGAGLASILVAHTLYAHQASQGTYQLGEALDLVWALGFTAFGAAAYVRLRAADPAGELTPQLSVGRQHRLNLVLPFMALVLSYAVLFGFHDAQAFRRFDPGVILLFVLLFARQGLAVMDTRRLTSSLEFQGRHDSLTGLLNRSSLARDLDHKIQAAKQNNAMVGVLFLDLDRMKHINDAYGHAAGDEVLRHLSQRLRSSTRSSDAIARFGGDEFVLTMTVSDRGQLTQVVQRLLTAISQPILYGDTEFHVTASIGIAVCPNDSADAATALHHADLAMYRAKALGKNAFSFYEAHDHAAHVQQVRLEEQLRDALRHGTLELHYQPIVTLTDTRVSGVEALLRWTSPGLGPVSPLRIVEVAEEVGLMPELGAWVLTEAVRQLAEWRNVHHMNLTVAVNVSASQFALADFVPLVKRVLAGSHLPGDALVLELTESTLIQDVEASAAKMRELKALGVRIALDDFGTGYSSLSYLRQLPVDILKIDRSFIATLPAEGDGFFRAILALAHDQGARVVAEGIEDARQCQLLKGLHCDMGQGYYFARPLPASELVADHPDFSLRVARSTPVETTTA